jgi:hypothetical protein
MIWKHISQSVKTCLELKRNIYMLPNVNFKQNEMVNCLCLLLLSGLQDFDLAIRLFIKKVKQSHCTPWRHLGGEGYSYYSFLTSELDGSEWSASCPGHALPPGKGPRYPLDRKLGGL